jgi:hypothetical protein
VDFVLDAIETEELTEQRPPLDNLAEPKALRTDNGEFSRSL